MRANVPRGERRFLIEPIFFDVYGYESRDFAPDIHEKFLHDVLSFADSFSAIYQKQLPMQIHHNAFS
jgi:hypothetical protein